MIDLVDAEPRADNFGFGKRGVSPGEGLDHPHLHRLFGECPDRCGRGQPVGGQRQSGFEHGPASDRPCTRRRFGPHGRLRISDSGPNKMRSV